MSKAYLDLPESTHPHSLRFVSRSQKFGSQGETQTDKFADEAIKATYHLYNDTIKSVIDDVRENWHRPVNDKEVLKTHVYKYGSQLPSRCTDGDYFAILKDALDELRPKDKIIPWTLGAVEQSALFHKTTSPGFPWTTKEMYPNGPFFKTKADVVKTRWATNTYHRNWDLIGRGVKGIGLPPCQAFHRLVASQSTKNKIRLTWGYPIDVTVEEARFFLPLFQVLKGAAQKSDFFYGIGLETALGGHEFLQRIANECISGSTFNGDLSEFDQHVTDWIIRDIFTLLSSFFDFTRVRDSEGKIWEVDPVQTQRRWNALVSYFVKTKIRLPTGGTIQKFQGVPSGSMFTNIIDTIVNCVQTRTVARRLDIPIYKDYYYGDDFTLITHGHHINVQDFSNVLGKIFGGILHPEKGDYVPNDTVGASSWLGYRLGPEGPYRDPSFLFASYLYPEREVTSALDSCSRLVGQMYSTFHSINAVNFYWPLRYLVDTYRVPKSSVIDFIQSMGLKRFRYFITLGWEIGDITYPEPLYDRTCNTLRIEGLEPRHSPRIAGAFNPLGRIRTGAMSYPPELCVINYNKPDLFYHEI
jgi:hypothetical protein